MDDNWGRIEKIDVSLRDKQFHMPNQKNQIEHGPFTCVEICAGAGGQALGLERAGFRHIALVEIEEKYCETLKLNRPNWNVINQDVKDFTGEGYENVDLFAGGVPCPPFSKAGKQLGKEDERDLFPDALRIVEKIKPKVVMLENVRGIFDDVFVSYRRSIRRKLNKLGYSVQWKLLNASDFGVPQLRPRAILIAVRKDLHKKFTYPRPSNDTITVGDALYDMIRENGWEGADEWRNQANQVAPTIVGGSKKHGGADLGPTRAKKAWAEIGIDGNGIVDDPPSSDFVGKPRLTNSMVACIQGFPRTWRFNGKKTSVYRQIGNAFPPPVAEAVGIQIIKTILN